MIQSGDNEWMIEFPFQFRFEIWFGCSFRGIQKNNKNYKQKNQQKKRIKFDLISCSSFKTHSYIIHLLIAPGTKITHAKPKTIESIRSTYWKKKITHLLVFFFPSFFCFCFFMHLQSAWKNKQDIIR